MSEDEFRALLAVEGKSLFLDDVEGGSYMASVIVGKSIIYDYAYGTSKEDAIDKLIRRHYADN